MNSISFADILKYGRIDTNPDYDSNGVFIQDINGKLWKTEEWNGSYEPNAIAVITPSIRFRMALSHETFPIKLNDTGWCDWEKSLEERKDLRIAEADYNGAENTKKILALQNGDKYAASFCANYIFPDGKTVGYLPSLGQLKTAYEQRIGINDAINACGGKLMSTGYSYYWSSTFAGDFGHLGCKCWIIRWLDGYAYKSDLYYGHCVRPFADFW